METIKKATVRLLIILGFLFLIQNVFSQGIRTNYFYPPNGSENQRIQDGVRLEVTIEDGHKVMIVAIFEHPENIEYLSVGFTPDEDSAQEMFNYSCFLNTPLPKYHYAYFCEEKDLHEYQNLDGSIDFALYYRLKGEGNDSDCWNGFGLTAKLEE